MSMGKFLKTAIKDAELEGIAISDDAKNLLLAYQDGKISKQELIEKAKEQETC